MDPLWILVGSIGVKNGWIGNEWLTIIAIALSLSFILASPLNSASHSIFKRWGERLRSLQTKTRLPHDQPIHPGDAQIAIFGMGRVGTAAYDDMRARHGELVIGIDLDPDKVKEHQAAGRNVIVGDATDFDFWARDLGFFRLRIADIGFRQKKELRALTGHCETQPSKRY